MGLIFEFIICAALIFLSSHYISNYGQSLAIKMNWHEGVIGVLFLAVATSLPELFTSISTVPINNINLGFGDAIGSLIINMMLIGVLDYFQGRGRILLHAEKKNILTCWFIILLLLVLAIFTFLRQKGFLRFYFFGIGIESFLILGLYTGGVWTIFRKRLVSEEKSKSQIDNSFIWVKFLTFFVIIIVLGFWLANIGKRVCESTNINQNFIGTLMLAFATSLPELAVSWSSLRLGSIDMAISNILGSNFFDVCIIPFMDIIYRAKPILQSIASINIFVTLLALVMTVVVIAGLSVRSKDTRMKLGWDTGLILALGIIGYYVIYRFG